MSLIYLYTSFFSMYSLLFPVHHLFILLLCQSHYSIAMIQSLNNFNLYENFAYHISLLRQFERSGRMGGGGVGDDDGSEVISSVHGNNVWSTFKKKKENNRRLGASGHSGGDPDNSIKSAKSTGGMKRNTTMFAVM